MDLAPTPTLMGLPLELRAMIFSYAAPKGEIHVRYTPPGLWHYTPFSDLPSSSWVPADELPWHLSSITTSNWASEPWSGIVCSTVPPIGWKHLPLATGAVSHQFQSEWLPHLCENAIFVLEPETMKRFRSHKGYLMTNYIRHIRIFARQSGNVQSSHYRFRITQLNDTVKGFGTLKTIEITGIGQWDLSDEFLASSVTHRGSDYPIVARNRPKNDWSEMSVKTLSSINKIISGRKSSFAQATILYMPNRVRILKAGIPYELEAYEKGTECSGFEPNYHLAFLASWSIVRVEFRIDIEQLEKWRLKEREDERLRRQREAHRQHMRFIRQHPRIP